MMTAIWELLSSKKFIVAVTACIVAVGGRWGLHIDPDLVDRIWIALLAFVGAQGMADFGKSAAIVSGASAAPVVLPTTDVVTRIGPTAILLIVGLCLGVATPACASWRQRTAVGVGAFLDCESPHVDSQLLAEATALGKIAVMSAISGSGHADPDQLKAAAAPLKSDLMRCGFVAAIAAAATPAPAQPGAPAAAPLEVDGAQLRAAFASVRAELGWSPVKVAGGTVL